jgi:hypothetical protein
MKKKKGSMMDIDGGAVTSLKNEENSFVKIDLTLTKNMRKIGCVAYGVYAVIRAHMDGKTRIANPEIENIAERTGCSKRKVMAAIKTLEFHHYLKVNRRHRKANSYFFPVLNLSKDSKKLPKDVTMRCPEHDLQVVYKGYRFICPVCKMDVGRYCEETLKNHYPELKKKELYESRKTQEAMSQCCASDTDYWKNELYNVYIPPVPYYKTKDIWANFTWTEEDDKLAASIPRRKEEDIYPALYQDFTEEWTNGHP